MRTSPLTPLHQVERGRNQNLFLCLIPLSTWWRGVRGEVSEHEVRS